MPDGLRVTLRCISYQEAQEKFAVVKPDHLDADLRWYIEPTWWDHLPAKVTFRPSPRGGWPTPGDDWPAPIGSD